jgi:hypothetical protein
LLEKKKKEEKEAINKLKRFLPNRIRPPKISLFEKKKKKKKKKKAIKILNGLEKLKEP